MPKSKLAPDSVGRQNLTASIFQEWLTKLPLDFTMASIQTKALMGKGDLPHLWDTVDASGQENELMHDSKL